MRVLSACCCPPRLRLPLLRRALEAFPRPVTKGNGMVQPKCGAPTQSGGRCQNKAIMGTSRCSKHQGPWSPYGVEQRKKKEAEAKMKKLRKKR